jgi:hypothetical protein
MFRVTVSKAQFKNMKINKTIFWTFSILVSLLSCYLFNMSSIQLYSDGEYMQSLKLPADADTPAVAIAGTVLLSIVAVVGHIILLGLFFNNRIFERQRT